MTWQPKNEKCELNYITDVYIQFDYKQPYSSANCRAELLLSRDDSMPNKMWDCNGKML